MEENELEEGETCSLHGDDANVNPDVDLSYIDEKIQHILGHFQKDFEGGVSAENLGAKFGGYGSFLPAYQRSPSIWPHPRSPQGEANHNISTSPQNLPIEAADRNSIVSTNASFSPRSSSTLKEPTLDRTGKSGACILRAPPLREDTPQCDLANTTSRNNDHVLKLRIKVGSDNVLQRSNASIYSVMGLEYSPSLSPDDSPGTSPGSSPEFQDAPESPMTVYQIMTCFPILSGYVLSPLSETLLHLMENNISHKRDAKFSISNNGLETRDELFCDSTSSRGVRHDSRKKAQSSGKNVKSSEQRTINDVTGVQKKVVDVVVTSVGEHVSNNSDGCMQKNAKVTEKKAERQLSPEMVKASCVLQEPDRISANVRDISPDFAKDESSVGIVISDTRKLSNPGNGWQPPKGKLNPRTASSDLASEDGKANAKRHGLSDPYVECGIRSDKSSEVPKLDGDESRSRKDVIVGRKEPLEINDFHECPLREQNCEQILHHYDHSSPRANEKPGNQVKVVPHLELPKEKFKAFSSVPAKEKKKNSHSKTDLSENKRNQMAPNKESRGIYSQEHDKSAIGGTKSEFTGKGTDPMESILKDKPRDSRIDYEKNTFLFVEKTKDRMDGKKAQNHPIPEALVKSAETTPLMANLSTIDVASAAPAPVVIKEHWVGCDRCQKWRLLPYGTNPDHLPKKWLCTMLNWLPGMNKCSISEEETTKALHALYQAPLPENHTANFAVTVSTEIHSNKFYEPGLDLDFCNVKKKHTQKDAPHVPIHMTHVSHPAMKNSQASGKSKSLDDVNQVASNSSSKSSFQHLSKSHELHVRNDIDRQKEKVKEREQFMNGDEFLEQNSKLSKFKSKRDFDQDGFRISKKLRAEGVLGADEDWHSDYDISGRIASSSNNCLRPKIVKGSLKDDAYSLKSRKCSSQDSLSRSRKKVKPHIKAASNGYSAFDVENFGQESCARKRKVKGHKDGHVHKKALTRNILSGNEKINSVKEEISESESRKEKRSRVSKLGGRETAVNKVENNFDKNGCITNGPLLNGRHHALDKMEDTDKDINENEQKSLNLDSLDTSKKDLPFLQPPTAATSSSSKVSGTQKSKSNFQEARGSPVESVSSSPWRILSMNKVTDKKYHVVKDEDIAIADCRSLDSYQPVDSNVQDAVKTVPAYSDAKDTHMSAKEGKIGVHLQASDNKYSDPQLFAFEVPEGTGISSHHQCHNDISGNVDGNNDGKLTDPSNSCGLPPDKSSKRSSHLREKHRSSKSETNKGKTKIPDSFSEHEDIHSSKKGSSYRHEAVMDPHRHSIFSHEGIKNINRLDKKDGKRKEAVGRQSIDGRRGNHMSFDTQENVESRRLLSKQNRDNLSKDNEMRNISSIGGKAYHEDSHWRMASKEDAKPSNHFPSDRTEKSVAVRGRGKSPLPLHPGDTTELSNQDSRVVLPIIKGGQTEAPTMDVLTGDPSQALKQPGMLDNQNGHRCNIRIPTLNGVDAPSPFRRETNPPAATIILKEARDLKHTANRMKNEGLEKESTRLYFEAALKFLHVAFLLETSSSDGGKHGSIAMYSDTGRFCEFVAHEYEKLKNMAAAALAYKCMEVAYMKVVFSKHSSASKDRHELNTALPMVATGESPSSSASDVDNLNNQSAMEKAPSAKGVISPQVAGNLVIIPRNRPHFMRLLNFAQDVNSAMEASRKSQHVFNVANSNQEELHYGHEIIASVRRALDHNFHDVEGLMHVVRLSINSTSLT